MSHSPEITFISDISCSWCAIGLHSLKTALGRIGLEPNITFEPFELNPGMPAGGQNLTEHVGEKYGSTPAQFADSREAIRARGETVGFVFNLDDGSRIFNTFDTHRILHWAGLEGRQQGLKERLFDAHFTDRRDPGDHDLLIGLVDEAGLDPQRARAILAGDEYAAEVRERERFWTSRGVRSVPTILFDGREAVVGGQTPDTFEAVIRRLTADTVQAGPDAACGSATSAGNAA